MSQCAMKKKRSPFQTALLAHSVEHFGGHLVAQIGLLDMETLWDTRWTVQFLSIPSLPSHSLNEAFILLIHYHCDIGTPHLSIDIAPSHSLLSVSRPSGRTFAAGIRVHWGDGATKITEEGSWAFTECRQGQRSMLAEPAVEVRECAFLLSSASAMALWIEGQKVG